MARPVRAGAIIFDYGLEHIVLVQNKHEHIKWGLPKGHLEKDETLKECARREVEEETGLSLKLSASCVCMQLRYNTVYFIYLADHLHPLKPQDTAEIGDVQWVSLRDMESWNHDQMNAGLKDLYNNLSVAMALAEARKKTLLY